MFNSASYKNLRLRGGFVIVCVEFTREPMRDALEREAVAQTKIVGRQFWLLIRAGLDDREVSISLYHEVLEAATVAAVSPPQAVMGLNEGDFERAAQTAHAQWGEATPENLNRLLQSYGFHEE
jgi:hypothetical protein